MKIQFLQDYRGTITNEIFYLAGTIVDLAPAAAHALIDAGRAVEVHERQPDKPKMKFAFGVLAPDPGHPPLPNSGVL